MIECAHYNVDGTCSYIEYLYHAQIRDLKLQKNINKYRIEMNAWLIEFQAGLFNKSWVWMSGFIDCWNSAMEVNPLENQVEWDERRESIFLVNRK